MKRIVITSLLYCIVLFTSTFAQTMSEVRQIRYKAIDLFDNYYSMILNLDNPDVYTYDNFSTLFENDAIIYNDILPDNSEQYINTKDYYQKYINSIKTYPKLSDLELSFPEYNNGKWHISLRFNKTIELKYKKSELTYPKWTFSFEMIVVINLGEAKIKSLKVDEPLKSYYVIEFNDSLLDDKVKGLFYKPTNEMVEFTDLHQRRLFNAEAINKEDLVLHKDIDDDFKTLIKQHPIDLNYYDYKIIPLKNIIGIGISYNPLQLNSNSMTPNFNNIKLKTFSTTLSVFYGRLLSSPNKHKFYLNVNPGLTINQISFKGSNYYEYESTDSDNDTYLRRITLTDIEEKDIFYCFDLPLGFGYVYNFGDYSFTIDIGAWISYSYSNTHKSTVNALYAGFYPQYWDLLIDQNGYYDFGQFKLGENKTNMFNNYLDYGTYSSIGLMYKLLSGLHLKFNFAYKFNFVEKASFHQNYQPTKATRQYVPFFHSIKKWRTNNISTNISIIKKI